MMAIIKRCKVLIDIYLVLFVICGENIPHINNRIAAFIFIIVLFLEISRVCDNLVLRNTS